MAALSNLVIRARIEQFYESTQANSLPIMTVHGFQQQFVTCNQDDRHKSVIDLSVVSATLLFWTNLLLLLVLQGVNQKRF